MNVQEASIGYSIGIGFYLLLGWHDSSWHDFWVLVLYADDNILLNFIVVGVPFLTLQQQMLLQNSKDVPTRKCNSAVSMRKAVNIHCF